MGMKLSEDPMYKKFQKDELIKRETAKQQREALQKMNDFVKTKSITFTVGGTTLTLSKTEARMLRDALNKFVDAFDSPRIMDWENAQTPVSPRNKKWTYTDAVGTHTSSITSGT